MITRIFDIESSQSFMPEFGDNGNVCNSVDQFLCKTHPAVRVCRGLYANDEMPVEALRDAITATEYDDDPFEKRRQNQEVDLTFAFPKKPFRPIAKDRFLLSPFTKKYSTEMHFDNMVGLVEHLVREQISKVFILLQELRQPSLNGEYTKPPLYTVVQPLSDAELQQISETYALLKARPSGIPANSLLASADRAC